MSVDLETFVRETIAQVARGVSGAHDAIAPLGGLVNPSDSGELSAIGHFSWTPDSRVLQAIEFDVAVTAQERSKDDAGGGIGIAVVAFGARSGTEASSETVSRVRFSVAVVLPSSEGIQRPPRQPPERPADDWQ